MFLVSSPASVALPQSHEVQEIHRGWKIVLRVALNRNAQCFETVRALRWPNGVGCPRWESCEMTQQGRDALNRSVSAIGVSPASDTLTMERTRSLPGIISPCGCGYGACLAWGSTLPTPHGPKTR